MTLILALLLLALVSWLAWRAGCSEWIAGLGSHRSLGRAQGTEHDPDLALRRSIGIPLSLAVVAVLSSTFHVLLCWLIPWLAERHYDSSIRTLPGVFAAMGLPHEDEELPGVADQVSAWFHSGEETKSAELLLHELVGESDSAVVTESVRKALKTFVAGEIPRKSEPSEDGKVTTHTTPTALRDMLVEIGQLNVVEENNARVASFLRGVLLPADQQPLSFEQALVRLGLLANEEAETGGGETKVDQNEPESPASSGSSDKRYLLAVKRNLDDRLEGEPGVKLVLGAVYERIREELLRFQRVDVLFNGLIQMATIVLFLLALILLGGRARVLRSQLAVIGPRFDDFKKDSDLRPEVKAALDSPREGDIVPKASPMSEAATERELLILEGYQRFLDRTPHFPNHAFAIGALLKIYRSWQGIWSTPGETRSPYRVGRDALSDLVERSESRLERVEYSLLDFLVWAMPSLGFIGTVVGISEALGNADEVVRASDQASQAEAISSVTATLGVAFDTTLVALVCTIPVMLLISLWRSGESRFLIETDLRISSSLFQEARKDGGDGE